MIIGNLKQHSEKQIYIIRHSEGIWSTTHQGNMR